MKKSLKYLSILFLVTLNGCTEIIDLYPESNLSTSVYYSNSSELRSALNGCYFLLQKPLSDEWSLTELRSDNALMSSPTSNAFVNVENDSSDRFYQLTTHVGVFNYWKNNYNSIRAINLFLDKLGANYNESSSTIELESISTPISDLERRKFISEACFLRAYIYFNLVRLYGGVLLVDEPTSPDEVKLINRSSVENVYKLIETDLLFASNNGSDNKFASIPPAELGLANSWSAKALLAKVYLTLNRKADAKIKLDDIIANSGYGLQSSYANVFSITNEMNSEILFAVRFKSGGVGLGNPLPNVFGPQASSNTVIVGGGRGYNTPTSDLIDSYATNDLRKGVNIGEFKPTVQGKYIKKYMSSPTVSNESENDWPVIRYADVLLMLAEAQGNTSDSWAKINQVHFRATATNLSVNTIDNAIFELALSNERRWEFAFENQRWFDLLRFNQTLSTISAKSVLDKHFEIMDSWYKTYLFKISLTALQGHYANGNLFLLPIPQYEIDTNSFISIPQNEGY